ncbi:hypothetical protein C9374_006865 [Naegleria lovaniensis]|uniref:Uncharacterized protein n=1 Tax=Naegleria lovaniensis TaxID=51637 RepID=A0AA88H491_NAELO|nr:uncharacterized protein C9374_006865 [Naegleria lovaniensis]KAG2393334.1 hypothetical protein C9374_006865 [Naegleria lovaniensis]
MNSQPTPQSNLEHVSSSSDLMINELSQIKSMISSLENTLKQFDDKFEKRFKHLESRMDVIEKVVNNIKIVEEEQQSESPSLLSSIFSRFSSQPPKSKRIVYQQPFTTRSQQQSSNSSKQLKIHVFVNDKEYEKTISDLLNAITGHAKQSYDLILEHKIITRIEEADNRILTLFVKYCGTSRFESKDARQIAEMKKPMHFLLLRYGETTSDVVLSDLYSNSRAFEFHVNNLEEKKVLMDDPRNLKAMNLLCAKVVEYEK